MARGGEASQSGLARGGPRLLMAARSRVTRSDSLRSLRHQPKAWWPAVKLESAKGAWPPLLNDRGVGKRWTAWGTVAE